jgi:hypothetical protein
MIIIEPEDCQTKEALNAQRMNCNVGFLIPFRRKCLSKQRGIRLEGLP